MNGVRPVLTDGERRALEVMVDRALAEDLGPDSCDLTEPALRGHDATADVVAREAVTVCGLEVAAAVFRARGVSEYQARVSDGDTVGAGTVLARIEGDAAGLLSAERVALNFLQRLSGIASAVQRLAAHAAPAQVYDTRKTTPGLRPLERYAVRCGGGHNHRFGLYDAAMVKDNHIDICGMESAVSKIRSAHPAVALTIEVRTLEELEQAIALAPELILLDNMSPEELRAAVSVTGGRVVLEASGGVTEKTIAGIAATGVERISVGAITHSVHAADIALDVACHTAG